MEVKLVAFESMGVRSMCTYVRTSDIAVLIDPGVACHNRSGIRPHPIEYEILVKKRAEILSLSRETDVFVISHYHIHHHSPQRIDLGTTFSTKALADEINKDKILLCKDPRKNIVEIQRKRGLQFHRDYGTRSPRYEVCDGRDFVFGRTRVSFSQPLWHGPEGSSQGYVLGTRISDEEETIVHASDVQLLERGCVDWMLGQEPDLVITAGPPLFDPERIKGNERSTALGFLGELSHHVPHVVVDHHLLRARDWQEFLIEVKNGVMCAAEHEGVTPLPLESRRSSLYEMEEVEEGFHKQLDDGEIPDRLRPTINDTGIKGFF
jgi:predicted metallo-beta-lactamase superfamily hydrolase